MKHSGSIQLNYNISTSTGMTLNQVGTGAKSWGIGATAGVGSEFNIHNLTDDKIVLKCNGGYNVYIPNGGLRVGGSSLASSAVFELSSTTKGALLPRMTASQRDYISSPATGLVIYNTNTNKYDYYNGSAWEEMSSSSIGFVELTIGDWNMDSTESVTKAHSLDWTKISNIEVIIINDAGTVRSFLDRSDMSDNGAIEWDDTNITLFRTAGGLYDNSSYDATSYNRGVIKVWYTV